MAKQLVKTVPHKHLLFFLTKFTLPLAAMREAITVRFGHAFFGFGAAELVLPERAALH